MIRLGSVVMLALTLGSVTLGCTAPTSEGAPSAPRVSLVHVGADEDAERARAVVELTRAGTVYAIDGVAHDRIAVSSPDGSSEPMDAWLARVGMQPASGEELLIAGAASDLRGLAPQLAKGGSPSGLAFTCTPVSCACTGDEDCNDMFGSGVCGGAGWCVNDVCGCLRH